jgi:hypothetical protein
MRDMVHMEQLYGQITGDSERFHAGDAAYIKADHRDNRPDHLVKAIEEVLPILHNRVNHLPPDNARLRYFLEDSLEAIKSLKDTLPTHKLGEFPMLQFWDLTIQALYLVHIQLEEKGL